MRLLVQVLGCGSPDAQGSVLVCTENARYLFGGGEGLQRLCVEHGVRLSKVEGIFLAQAAPACTGGLPGLLLTLADAGRRSIEVCGPPGLHDYLFGLRHFMMRSDVALRASQLASAPHATLQPIVYSDLSVTPVVLWEEPGSAAAPCAGAEEALAHMYAQREWAPFRGGAQLAAVLRRGQGSSDPAPAAAAAAEGGQKRKAPAQSGAGGAAAAGSSSSSSSGAGTALRLPSPFNPLALCSWPPGTAAAAAPWVVEASLESPAASTAAAAPPALRAAACYICQSPTVLGKFYPDRAKALGVKPGPLFGKLSRGEEVTVELPAPLAQPEGASAADAPAPAPRLVTVFPSQVKDPDLMGEAFAIVACPSLSFLRSLTLHPSFEPYRLPRVEAAAAAASSPRPALPSLFAVYHAAPPDVLNSQEYLDWMTGFGLTTRHIVLSPPLPSAAQQQQQQQQQQQHPIHHLAQAVNLCKLHFLNPAHFVLPHPLPHTIAQLSQHFCALAAARAPSAGTSIASTSSTSPSCPLQALARAWVSLGMLTAPGTAPAAAAAAAASGGAAAACASAAADAHTAAPSPFAQARTPFSLPWQAPDMPPGAALAAASTLHAPPLYTLTLLPVAQQHQATFALGPLDVLGTLRSLFEQAVQGGSSGSHSHLLDCIAEALGLQRKSTAAVPAPPPQSASALPALAMPPQLGLLFTGTGSAIPSKYRNVTGILCQPPPLSAAGAAAARAAGNPYLAHCARANVLFDCGEGTLGQLFRALGAGEGEAGSGPAMGAASGSGPLQSLPLAASLEEALAGLALLSISHLHADHHLGLASLVAARARVLLDAQRTPGPPLLIVGPSRLYLWLLEATRLDASLVNAWVFADCENFTHVSASMVDAAAAAAAAAQGSGGAASAAASAAALYEPCVADAGDIGEPAFKARRVMSPVTLGGLESSSFSRTESAALPVEVAECSMAAGEEARALPPPQQQQQLTAHPHPTGLPAPESAPTSIRHLPVHTFFPLAGHSRESEGGMGRDDFAAAYLATAPQIELALCALGVTGIKCVRVRHCHRAYAVRVEGGGSACSAEASEPWACVFSGDTRPCEEVVALCRGGDALRPLPYTWTAAATHTAAAAAASQRPASLLIHEATFDDTAEGKAFALEKRHSTAEEALGVGARGGVGFVLLTHFSARHPKIPVMGRAGSSAGGAGSFVAYDLFSVRGKDFAALPALLPVLHELFAEEEEEEKEEKEAAKEESVEGKARGL